MATISTMKDELHARLWAAQERWFALKECGATEISVELAMGVIARLLPEEAQDNLEAAHQHTRRWAH